MATTFEIHPSIGIARVGTSANFFIGPEPGATAPATYRDAEGELLRQAARFRVFRCDRDAQGLLTSATEITSTTTIKWTVQLANRKAVAPQFAPITPSSTGRRNSATGDDTNPLDRSLIIGPVQQSVQGHGVGRTAFPAGSFKGTPVHLGDLATDSYGALLVLGGHGVSDSVPARATGPGTPPLESFADSNGWFDDISDGPVQATITLPDGTSPAVVSAWVLVGPPDFAPPIQNFVTLYDMARQVAIDAGWLSQPNPILFSRHVQPILMRAVGYGSVNRLARASHGSPGPADFESALPALSATVSSGPLANVILNRLREPGTISPPNANPMRWMPRLHDENNNNQVLALTMWQYAILREWSLGNYEDDFAAPISVVELLPDALDRVALEACSGGAFFPGIEVGRICKNRATYSGPFRINPALKAGELTAGNALPWQADFAACRYEAQRRIAWWPAQRPDEVIESSTSTQKDWGFGANTDIEMVDNWSKLGIVFIQFTDPETGQTSFRESERTLPRP